MLPRVMIWDLGGVFVDFTFEHLSERFMSTCSVSSAAAETFFGGENFFRYERGEIGNEEFFEAVRRELGYKHDYSHFTADFCECMDFSLNRQTHDLYNRLKVKYGDRMRFWKLSNLNPLHRDYIHSRWPGLTYNFEKEFLSFRMGCRKPEPEIYIKMLAEGGAEAAECLFIDDMKINTDAAESLGVKSLLFEGADKLEIVLRAMGIAI